MRAQHNNVSVCNIEQIVRNLIRTTEFSFCLMTRHTLGL